VSRDNHSLSSNSFLMDDDMRYSSFPQIHSYKHSWSEVKRERTGRTLKGKRRLILHVAWKSFWRELQENTNE
jgi:hypothetical protein